MSCSNAPSLTLAAELPLEQGQDQGQYSYGLTRSPVLGKSDHLPFNEYHSPHHLLGLAMLRTALSTMCQPPAFLPLLWRLSSSLLNTPR